MSAPVLVSSRSPFPDHIKARAVDLICQGLSSAAIARSILEEFNISISRETVRGWRNDPDLHAITYGQSLELGIRFGELQHQLADELFRRVNDGVDRLALKDLLWATDVANRSRGTAVDKVLASPAPDVNVNHRIVAAIVATVMGEGAVGDILAGRNVMSESADDIVPE